MLKQSAEQHFFFSQQMALNMSILQMNKTTLDVQLTNLSKTNPFIKHTSLWKENNAHRSKNNTLMPDVIENTIKQEKKLFDNLREELFLQLEENDFPLLQLLIGNLDHNGFLTITCEELVQGTSLEQKKLETIRNYMMNTSYLGLGAYNSSEYMMFMTEHIYKKDSLEYKIAEQITAKKKKSPNSIQKILKAPMSSIIESLEKINMLPPSPLQEESIAILPDVIVKLENGLLKISPISYGHTVISTEIDDSLTTKYSKQELKKLLKDALHLKKALEIRLSSFQKYAEILILTRSDFFIPENSEKEIHITLKDIAKLTGRNVSTISRALKNRYFLFNYHTYAFSELLTHKVGNSNDFEIKKQLKEILKNESADSRLSDELLATILKKKGFQISRRTVAKYREQLHIGSIYQR